MLIELETQACELNNESILRALDQKVLPDFEIFIENPELEFYFGVKKLLQESDLQGALEERRKHEIVEELWGNLIG